MKTKTKNRQTLTDLELGGGCAMENELINHKQIIYYYKTGLMQQCTSL